MRTGLKTIEHVDVKYFNKLKEVEVRFAIVEGIVYVELCELIAKLRENLPKQFIKNIYLEFRNEARFNAWLKDYKELLNTYAPQADLWVQKFKAKIKVEMDYPIFFKL